jgi:hypothetical protein
MVTGLVDELYTRKRYLLTKAFQAQMEQDRRTAFPHGERGMANLFVVAEAVSSTLLEHPELDPNEKKTWQEWEKSNG